MTQVEDTSPAPGDTAVLASYVPRLIEHVEQHTGGSEQLLVYDGTLVSADISGFTALSERLAGLGHEGAEELTDLLNDCFGQMIGACEQWGGDIVKFGGDALLVLFTEDGHAVRAAAAMERMRSIVSQPWSTNSVSRVRLGISQGAHSGQFGFSLVDGGHLELLVGGPGVTSTIRCESDAGRGQILLSDTAAALVPERWLGDTLQSGARPLRRGLREVSEVALRPVPAERGIDGLGRYLAPPLIDAVLAGSHGEHRQVAVAFVNIGGTDDFFHAHGALALQEACQEIARNVCEVLANHPVHLLASDAYENGAELILTAGAPISTDADDDHLLLALHDLLQRPSPLVLRAGVNRGHVYVGDLGSTTRRAFTVMGDAVNLAARLMQKSAPGQIVASSTILERAETPFDVDWLEPFMVKGKSKPIEAGVLGAPEASGADEGVDPDVGPSAYFAGRNDEVRRLDELANDAAAGIGAVVQITGEPGIGKSRLVREVLTHRPELDRQVFRGGQYARNSPYFVVRTFLRTLVGTPPDRNARDAGDELRAWVHSTAPVLEPWLPLLAIAYGAEVPSTPEVDRIAEEFRRDRIISVVADAIDAALDSPTAIVGEDVHVLDSASLDVITELARRVAGRPWLVLLAHRGLAVSSIDGADRHQVIELGPLDTGAAVELATSRAGADIDDRQIAQLVERSAGHPLFLLELMTIGTTGADALPDSIESLVTARIDTLPADDRLLLREAAVAGQVVDTDVMAAAFGRPELADVETWTTLADFLEERAPGVLRFRQELYRAVAYSGLAYRRRREAHLALGVTIEQRGADDLRSVAALLATHFDTARSHERAWTYSVLGGDASRDTYANDEAITLYRSALRHAMAAPDPNEVARVAEALGDVLQLSGSYEDARLAYQRAREASDDDGRIGRARLQRKIGYVREREGSLSQALRWYTKAQQTLERSSGDREAVHEEAEIALSRAGALNRRGRNTESALMAERAAELAAAADDRLGIARAYNVLEVAYSTLGRPEARECAQRALELFEGSGDLVGEANVLNNLGVQAYYSGQWDSATEYYSRSRELRRQAGDVVGEAMATNNLAEVLSLQGRLDEAQELFEHARRRWQSAHYRVGVAYVTANLAVTAARAGDPATGLTRLEDARSLATEVGATALGLEMDVKRVECLVLDGRPADAIDVATPLHDQLVSEHAGDDEFTTQLEVLMSTALTRLERFDDAIALIVSAGARAERTGDRFMSALVALTASQQPANAGTAAELRRTADEWFAQLGVVAVPAVLEPHGGHAPPQPERRATTA